MAGGHRQQSAKGLLEEMMVIDCDGDRNSDWDGNGNGDSIDINADAEAVYC
jgi:hypothetical protein